MLRNEFASDLDIPKSKFFPSASTIVGPPVATKPRSFYSPEPLPTLSKPLENLEALILKLINYALVDI